MSIGIERFQTGWDNNDNYINIFSDDILDYAGFSFLILGSFNLATQAYTNLNTFTATPYGQKLAVTVTTALGVSLSPTTTHIIYFASDSTPVSVFPTFTEGSPAGTTKVPTLPLAHNKIVNISFMTASPVTTGTLQLAAPRYLAESFIQSEWPPATPGL